MCPSGQNITRIIGFHERVGSLCSKSLFFQQNRQIATYSSFPVEKRTIFVKDFDIRRGVVT